jgi:TolB-like protein
LSTRSPAAAIAAADRAAQAALAQEATLDPARIPPSAVSVLPFEGTAGDAQLTALGYALSDFLLADLASSPRLRLVERQQVGAMLRELKLVDAGVVDPRTAPRVGRLVGARRVVIGSVRTAPGDRIVLGARIVDAIAGTVQDVTTGTAPIARVIDAEKELAFLIFDRLGISLTPAQRAQVAERQSANLAATLAFGRGVQAESRGDPAGAAQAYREAVRLDASFASARTELRRAEGGAPTTARSPSLTRVLELSTAAVNAPAPTRLPEASDAPLQSFLVTWILNITIF